MRNAEWTEIKQHATQANQETIDKLKKRCQHNSWLKVGGIEFSDGECAESDYGYDLWKIDDADWLAEFFWHGNWGIRTAIQYKDLIFVNQVNGGDEWWALKGDNMSPFESVSWWHIIKQDGIDSFYKQLEAMAACTVDECRTGHWYKISH